MVKIEILNPILSNISEGKPFVSSLLTYSTFTVKLDKKTKRRKKQYYKKSVIYSNGLFLTGFIPRIKEYCNKNKIELRITESEEFKFLNRIKPQSFLLSNIQLRPDQEHSAVSLLKGRRGIFLAHPRYGKSYVMASVLQAFRELNCLVLCSRTSILSQLKTDFISIGLKCDKIDFFTPQTASKLDLWSKNYSVVLVDEAHIGCGFSTMYDTILSSVAAPIRLAFTGTLPRTEEQRTWLEGMFGPIVKEINFEEGRELNLLTKVKLKLIPVPRCREAENIWKYADIYKISIVDNRTRNRLVLNEAKKLSDEGKSVLIFVTQIEHGENLCSMAEAIGIETIFVKGNTVENERIEIKEMLKNKKIKIVISTVVWREGLTFPSLDAIIYACSGRSDVATIQGCGRALGKHVDKSEALIIDFLDIGKYVSEHFVERFSTYQSLGWI